MLYASTRDKEATVKIVKESKCVSIIGRKGSVKTAEVLIFASTRECEVFAQIAKEVLYASTTEESTDAKSVWLQHHVSISLIESNHEIYSSSNIMHENRFKINLLTLCLLAKM